MMKSRKCTKHLSLLLALAMVVTLFALPVAAAEAQEDALNIDDKAASGDYSGAPVFHMELGDPNSTDNSVYVCNVFLYRDPDSKGTYLIGDRLGSYVYENGCTEITIYGDNGWNQDVVYLGYSRDFSYYYAPGLMNMFPYVPGENIPSAAYMAFRRAENGSVTSVKRDDFDLGNYTDNGEGIMLDDSGAEFTDYALRGAPVFDSGNDKIVGMVSVTDADPMAVVRLVRMSLPYEMSMENYLGEAGGEAGSTDPSGGAEEPPADDDTEDVSNDEEPADNEDEEENNSGEPEVDELEEWEMYLPIIVCVVLGVAVAAFLLMRKKSGQNNVPPMPPVPPVPPVPPTPPVPPMPPVPNGDGGMLEMDLPLGGTIGGINMNNAGLGGTINVNLGTMATEQWQLRALNGVHYGKTFPIVGTALMGRTGECSISFPEGTPGISGRHCQLTVTPAGMTLVDLGSSYGTFMGGQRLQPNVPVSIKSGDSFTLAPNGQSFRLEAAGATVGSSFFKPVVRSGSGVEYRADDRGRLTFGRNPDNQVTIQEKSVSGRHCVLYREGGQLFLRDEGSTNGTFINGQRLAPGQSVPVGKGTTFFLYNPNYSFTITEV